MANLNAGEFRQLMERIRCGDQDAAATLVREFEPEIQREIRIRLTDVNLRRTVDSVDICQSTFGAFFVGTALGRFELKQPIHLVRLLVRIAQNKIIDRHRRQNRRVPPAATELVRMQSNSESLDAIDPGASPSDVLDGREMLEQVQGLLTQEEWEISQLRGQGKSWQEIAAARGLKPDALRKKLSRAYDRVLEELEFTD